jgi:HAMP domain-containing protein
MDTKEAIRERLTQIQERQQELSEIRHEMASQMVRAVGTNEDPGVEIDPLTAWARRVKNVNTEMKALAEERRWLRESRRRLNPCECDCHQS